MYAIKQQLLMKLLDISLIKHHNANNIIQLYLSAQSIHIEEKTLAFLYKYEFILFFSKIPMIDLQNHQRNLSGKYHTSDRYNFQC